MVRQQSAKLFYVSSNLIRFSIVFLEVFYEFERF